MPARNFFVLTTTRSGSTWLLSLLNAQPGVAAYEELFLWQDVKPRFAWVSAGSPERYFSRRHAFSGPRPLRLWRYLAEVENHRHDVEAQGFKLMIGHLPRVPDLLPVLALRRYRLILLVRENIFDSTISDYVNRAVSDPHGRVEQTAIAPLTVDIPQILAQMRRRRRGVMLQRAIRQLWPAPSVEIHYETMKKQQQQTLGTILGVLNIRQDTVLAESQLKKRVKGSYGEFITNYAELCSAVSAAGFGRYLPVTNND